MNKHISLVKKWLNDPDSVSVKELLDNMNVADRAASKGDGAWWFLRQSASARASADAAARAAADAAAVSAYCTSARAAARGAAVSAYCTSTSAAAHWVKKYEELTNEWK